MARSRTLGLVAPSGYLPNPAVIDRAAGFFTRQGWRVIAGESVFAREQRFAGPDALRLAELQRFATDPSIDLVLSARGGYGLSRLLDRIDFAAIRARKARLAGYSDFTAFNLAYLARGGVSFAAPSAGDFGAEQPDPFTVEHFFGVLGARTYAVDLAVKDPGGLSASARISVVVVLARSQGALGEPFPGPRRMALAPEGFLYLVDGRGGFHVLTARGEQMAELELPDRALAVAAAPGLAYVSTTNGKILA